MIGNCVLIVVESVIVALIDIDCFTGDCRILMHMINYVGRIAPCKICTSVVTYVLCTIFFSNLNTLLYLLTNVEHHLAPVQCVFAQLCCFYFEYIDVQRSGVAYFVINFTVTLIYCMDLQEKEREEV